MNIFKNSLIKNTLIYTISDGICKGISFLMLPIVSYYLVPEQLGIAANFDVLQSILMLLAGQATVNALPYFYYNRSKDEIKTLVSSLLFIVIILNVIFSIIIFFISGVIEQYAKIGLLLQLLTIISVVSHLLNQMNFVLYRLEEKPFIFAKLQIMQSVLYTILIVILVINMEMAAIGRIYSMVFSCLALSVVHCILLKKRHYLSWKINKKTIIELLKFGTPLIPHSLSFWLKGGMDKILLTTYCGLAANGLYSMAMSIGALYTIFRTAFSNAFTPYFQKRLNSIKNENREQENVRLVILSYKMIVFFLLLYILIVCAGWVIVNYLLSSKYLLAFHFIPWILFALTLNSIYLLVVEYPYAQKKTFGLGLITFSGSVFQLLLTYFLVSNLGVNGINYSVVLGALMTLIGVWWYSNKVYPMPWISSLHSILKR